jgi:hypothetical protein
MKGMIMEGIMPLKKVVVYVTNQADANDQQSIKKAVRSWHNMLANGSLPRSLVIKLGKELYLDLEAWKSWIKSRNQHNNYKGPGRPRSNN